MIDFSNAVAQAKTKTISDNGFNPFWDEPFEFRYDESILSYDIRDRPFGTYFPLLQVPPCILKAEGSPALTSCLDKWSFQTSGQTLPSENPKPPIYPPQAQGLMDECIVPGVLLSSFPFCPHENENEK